MMLVCNKEHAIAFYKYLPLSMGGKGERGFLYNEQYTWKGREELKGKFFLKVRRKVKRNLPSE